MHQGDGIEDALDNPQLFDVQQFDARRAPPKTTRAVTGLEPRLHLAEPVRPVDQTFPVATFLQRKAHRRAAGIQFAGEIRFLRKPALNQIEPKASSKFQIGTGGGAGVLLAGRGALAPVFEQVFVDFFNVPGLATFAPAAADHPRIIVEGVQLLFLARRAFALAHVFAGFVLQSVVGFKALQNIGA